MVSICWHLRYWMHNLWALHNQDTIPSVLQHGNSFCTYGEEDRAILRSVCKWGQEESPKLVWAVRLSYEGQATHTWFRRRGSRSPRLANDDNHPGNLQFTFNAGLHVDHKTLQQDIFIPDLAHLILRCLALDPDRRITASDALAHRFFKTLIRTP